MTDPETKSAPSVEAGEPIQTADPSALAAHIVENDLGPDAVRALLGGLPDETVAHIVSAITPDAHAREVLLWLPRE